MAVIIAAVLLALAAPATQAALAPPVFAPGPCPQLPAPSAAMSSAHCGFLTVPENRKLDNGKTIRLAVAIVPAQSPTSAPDPVIHLTGGPGGIAMLEGDQLVAAGLNRDRDLILLEQRGEKYSVPELTCPVIDRYNLASLDQPLDSPANGRAHVKATAACRNQLAGSGIDLSAYNTTENAADVDDLRKALGLAQVDLFALSYGTDVALTAMRDHPEGIRAVILDSTVPPGEVALPPAWSNARDGFDALFAACAQQARCRREHPHLASTFNGLVRKLEAHPLTTAVRLAGAKARTKVTLDGGALVAWMVNNAFATPNFPNVPAEIDALAAGHPKAIATARAASVAAVPPGLVGYGLLYGVICGEWVPHVPSSGILPAGRRAFPSYPRSVLAQAPQFPFMPQDCHVWNVPPQPASQRSVVTSTIPTLLLAGGFDTATPVRWANLAAQTLSSSTVAVIPGVGHFVVPESPCAQSAAVSFLANPNAPDTSCVAGLRPPPFR